MEQALHSYQVILLPKKEKIDMAAWLSFMYRYIWGLICVYIYTYCKQISSEEIATGLCQFVLFEQACGSNL